MHGKIIKDYLGVWRWGRIKALLAKNNSWLLYIYLLLVIPGIWFSDYKGDFLIQYYACILSLIWEQAEAELLPLGLKKIQYLCPMSALDRKKYLVSMYWLKVFLPTVLFFMIQAVCTGLQWIHPGTMVLSTVMCFLFSMVFQLNPRLPMEKGSAFYGFGILQSVVKVIGSVVFVTGTLCAPFNYDDKTLFWAVFYAVSVLLQLFMTGKVMSHFRRILEALLHYEIVSAKLQTDRKGQGWL